jgi:G3E family GTPase
VLRGDLVSALENLLRDLDNGRIKFRRAVLETTGLADPAPVLQTIMAHPYLVMRYRLDGVVTVVDAINGAATFDDNMESVKQVAVADRIVLTKTDLVETHARRHELARLRARLKRLNPAAPVLDAIAGEAKPARLLGCGLYDPKTKIPDVKRWLAAEAYESTPAHHHADAHGPEHKHDSGDHADANHGDAHSHDVNRHDARIRAVTLATDTPIPAASFEMFADLLRSLHGPKLLRLKGIVQIAEEPDRPLVIHGVQHVMHPPVRFDAWPDPDHRTRIVIITRDLEPQYVTRLFDAFLGRAGPDQPDRTALFDNPLVPFGGIDR